MLREGSGGQIDVMITFLLSLRQGKAGKWNAYCVCVLRCFILRTIKVVFWRFSIVPFAARACTIGCHGRHLKAVLTAFFQPCERKVRERKESKMHE